MKTKKHDEREIPIDVYTKMQHMLVVGSLREVMDNVSFERLIKQITVPVMGIESLRDYFNGEVGITAGDESVPKKRHELDYAQKTIHIYFGVYVRCVGSFRYTLGEDGDKISLLGLRIDPPNEDDYFILGARKLSEDTINHNKLHTLAPHKKIERITRVLEDQWTVAKQLGLLKLIINESRKLSREFKLVIALMDGSILPWELNMDVSPGSKLFSGLPDELVDKILRNERKNLRGFNELFNEVYNSGGVILVGAVKKSSDWTLQEMVGRAPDKEGPDQVLLSNIMEANTVFKVPFRSHRFDTFVAKLNKFKIGHGRYVIGTYYIRHDLTAYPLRLEVLAPRGLPGDVITAIPHLLTHLAVTSERHTFISKSRGGSLGVPTLLPIYVVDHEVRERGIAEIAEAMYVIDKEWERIREILKRNMGSNNEFTISWRGVKRLLGGGGE
jgi:hypothetical protein